MKAQCYVRQLLWRSVESVPTSVESVPTNVESVPTSVESVPTRVESVPTSVESIPRSAASVPKALNLTSICSSALQLSKKQDGAMANITVFKKAERTEARGKLLIEDFLGEMKEPKPAFFKSDTFKVGDFSFQMKLLVRDPRNESNDFVYAYIYNPADTDFSVARMSLEANIISSQSTETINLKKINNPKEFTLKAKQHMGIKFFRHAECEEVCKEGNDLLVMLRMELQGTERKVSSSVGTSLNCMRKRRCAGDVLANVYKKMRDADFVLICSGESVPCHKNILSGASSVFDAMLGNKMTKEAIEGKVHVEISAEVGRAFVEYIYTAKLDKDILEREAVAFLEVGDKYQVPGLKELAEEEMINQLTRVNMVNLLALSDLYRAKELREATINFTKLNMSWLREDQGRMAELKNVDKDLLLELL